MAVGDVLGAWTRVATPYKKKKTTSKEDKISVRVKSERVQRNLAGEQHRLKIFKTVANQFKKACKKLPINT